MIHFAHMAHPRRWWLAALALLALAVSHRLEAQELVVLRAPSQVFVTPSFQAAVAYRWPEGIEVAVLGCLPDRSWCTVRWGSEQGWVQEPLLLWVNDPQTSRLSAPPWPTPIIIYRVFLPPPDHHHPHHHGEPWHRPDSDHRPPLNRPPGHATPVPPVAPLHRPGVAEHRG